MIVLSIDNILPFFFLHLAEASGSRSLAGSLTQSSPDAHVPQKSSLSGLKHGPHSSASCLVGNLHLCENGVQPCCPTLVELVRSSLHSNPNAHAPQEWSVSGLKHGPHSSPYCLVTRVLK